MTEFIVALPGVLAAIVAGLGWWRESRKDKGQERRSDLDILLSGYQQLVNDEGEARTKAEKRIADAMKRALDCEEREKALGRRVSALEGAIRGD